MKKSNAKEEKILRSLNTPEKIQDFLNSIPMRFDGKGHIVHSPKYLLRKNPGNCIEGALLASAALFRAGEKALLLDLKVAQQNNKDVDHVVALFKRDGLWGAISKTNHGVLRYREPIYKNVRELAMTYFHEYFTNDGTKTLRSFSAPFDVVKHFGTSWIMSDEDLCDIAVALDDSPHTKILDAKSARRLRRAEPVEIAMGKITEWKKNKRNF